MAWLAGCVASEHIVQLYDKYDGPVMLGWYEDDTVSPSHHLRVLAFAPLNAQPQQLPPATDTRNNFDKLT